MEWLRRLFGARKDTGTTKPATFAKPVSPATQIADPVSKAVDAGITFSRMTPNPKSVKSGSERATFLAEVANILGAGAEPIESGKSLQAEYGFDEMEVSECVQYAEEVWAIQLLPNPMRVSDYADMLRRFPTLDAIMQEAEGVAAERRSGK